MRPSLARAFTAAALASVLVVAVALGIFLRSSRQAALGAAERSRRAEAERVEARVAQALGAAQDALDDVQRALSSGAVDAGDLRALEALLYTELLGARHVAEVTFTRATLLPGADPDEPAFEAQGRLQLSLLRTPDGRLATRRTEAAGDGFQVREWLRAAGSTAFDVPGPARSGDGADPTLHPTFQVSVAQGVEGAAIWSDLHYSELDAGAAEPRVVLSVQQAVWGSQRQLLGVVRVGLLTTDLDAITETPVPAPPPAFDPRKGTSPSPPPQPRVALLAADMDPEQPARLVARVRPADRVVQVGDDLRIQSLQPPAEVAALLDSPLVRGLDPEAPSREGTLEIQGEPWLATLSALSIARGGTQGWLVAVLVPESAYTRELVQLGQQLSLVFGVTLVIVLGVGAALLATVQRGLARAGVISTGMRNFDFGARTERSALRDIDELLSSLELAKTVTRAMCKYIPVPLVRRLYERNRDPELGGEQCELTLLFTDLQGFTSLSERLEPGDLARRLGRYFEVLTTALEAHGATIDKYIGDAVMAFWNAPVPVEDHSRAACRGVLAAQVALAELYASAEWQGLPALVTRFGLHRTQALVGHFGAPTRLAYTALGDGVNLTSRLESLGKEYGVTTLASASVVEAAGEGLAFRHVDRVVVRGKSEAVDVYELLGVSALPAARYAAD